MAKEVERNWPAWYFGPDGESKIFTSIDDVPEGWLDHPSKHESGEGIDADKLGATGSDGEPVVSTNEEGEHIDASGWAWDAGRNVTSKAQTRDGLWLLKPGQSRPAPKPGFPKEPVKLDL